MGENMKNILKKPLLIIISSLLMVFTLTACFPNSNDNHSKGNGTLPITMNVGKYTVTILDNVYVNYSFTATYVVESTDGDFDDFLFWPLTVEKFSTSGLPVYERNISNNKRYVVFNTTIENNDTPEDLLVKYWVYDKSGDKDKTSVSNAIALQKNAISDFDYVQARVIDKIIPTIYGEMEFYMALYTEEKVIIFVKSLGTKYAYNFDSYSSESEDRYYFKVNDAFDWYNFVSRTLMYKNNNPIGTSPQIIGYGEDVNWLEMGTIEIPVNRLPDDETFILNMYESNSNQLVESIDLEILEPPHYNN